MDEGSSQEWLRRGHMMDEEQPRMAATGTYDGRRAAKDGCDGDIWAKNGQVGT